MANQNINTSDANAARQAFIMNLAQMAGNQNLPNINMHGGGMTNMIGNIPPGTPSQEMMQQQRMLYQQQMAARNYTGASSPFQQSGNNTLPPSTGFQ